MRAVSGAKANAFRPGWRRVAREKQRKRIVSGFPHPALGRGVDVRGLSFAVVQQQGRGRVFHDVRVFLRLTRGGEKQPPPFRANGEGRQTGMGPPRPSLF